MSEATSKLEIPREQIRAIRKARRYLKSNQGSLARILNAYKSAEQMGEERGFLSER